VASVLGNHFTYLLSSSGPNLLRIYAQPSANANINDANTVNQYSGAGNTLILSGHILPTNFTSSFEVNPATDPRSGGTPVALNQHTGGSDSYAGVQTFSGTGNSSITVAVDSYLTSYFLTSGGLRLTELNFNTVSSGVPFIGVDPALKMFDGTIPNVASVNGASGPDFLSQSQANTSFALRAIPEPGSVSLLAMGVGGLALAASLRRRGA
jgi:hypothetical protein